MDRDWESIFKSWSKPSSDTEEEKCNNASRMIKDAILNDPVLSEMNIEIFAQGSYRNNTNVRLDSDVDICVRLMDTFFYKLPSDMNNPMDYQITPSNYTFHDYKNTIENALVNKFGRSGVKRGNKAFDLHENSYRVDADVVACFEHRRYVEQGTQSYISGTEFWTDKGEQVINWPHQHYNNGVQKNKDNGNRFKYITRVLKRLKNEMNEKRIMEATNIPSFLIECLTWNVPNDGYSFALYTDCVRYVLAYVFNETRKLNTCEEWGEVSELKYLFTDGQAWTYQQVNSFSDAAWDYIGFE